ncbi:GTPase [Desulfonatronovibrio magnus]|uniref:GTPase n=1 Tax=Desulfonatronovibrio magnus TaxID=698827 RepID=UPI0018DB1251|nr:GTPase [Desulfonatronovibrio magnus]
MSQQLDQFMGGHSFDEFKPSVAVFGENSTGKSTFLNALLGTKDQFKMGLGETTQKVTALYRDHCPDLDPSLNIEMVRADYDYLNYMNLLDVPGFGQTFSHDDLSHLLTAIDVLFWVVDTSSGFKKDDLEFLQALKGSDAKIIVILNKIDALCNERTDSKVLISEINKQVKQVNKLFQEQDLSDRLVAIFTFSALKSLVGKIKESSPALDVLEFFMKKVLLTTVFMLSFQKFSLSEIEELVLKVDDFYFDKTRYNAKVDIGTITQLLEADLKNNISFIDSINPFSSKDDKARPIVIKYQDRVHDAITKRCKSLYEFANYESKKTIDRIKIFSTFSDDEFIPSFTLDINLNHFSIVNVLEEVSDQYFLGDSYAEDIVNRFKDYSEDITERNLNSVSEHISEKMLVYAESLQEYCIQYSKKLNSSLVSKLHKVQNNLIILLIHSLTGDISVEDKIHLVNLRNTLLSLN